MKMIKHLQTEFISTCPKCDEKTMSPVTHDWVGKNDHEIWFDFCCDKCNLNISHNYTYQSSMINPQGEGYKS